MHYIYLRVSTDKQADSNAGLNAQLDACTNWCDREGVSYHYNDDFKDAGVSASIHPFDRPGFAELVKKLEPGDCIVVAKRDRISRNYLQLLVLEHELLKDNITIIDAGGVNGDSPEDKLARGMFDLFAEYEREITRKRTELSIASKKKRGEAYCGRLYGYKNVDGQFVEDDYEQSVITDIKYHRDKSRWSFRNIAEWLNRMNVDPPRGKQWYPATISEILKREEKQ